MTFEEIEKEITQFAKNSVVERVSNEKLQKELMLVAANGIYNKIMLFAEEKGTNEIAKILYAIRGKRVYISEFEVNVKYQKAGWGRLIFNLALAHADLEGVTFAYGDAEPINDMSDVDVNSEDNFQQISQKIMEVYKKLGCSFKGDSHRYETTWEKGKKVDALDEKGKQIVQRIYNLDHQNELNV